MFVNLRRVHVNLLWMHVYCFEVSFTERFARHIMYKLLFHVLDKYLA
jgi:hypothetical protein